MGIQARVVRVIDGDTIEVVLNGARVTVRYYGVNTPESNQRCFREATNRNRQLAGSMALLEPDARNTDQYGRLPRYVYTADGEVMIDAALVAEGYGEAWRSDGKHRNMIISLQNEASRAGRGCLWGG